MEKWTDERMKSKKSEKEKLVKPKEMAKKEEKINIVHYVSTHID